MADLTKKFDVLVIGGGNAALCAAISARRAGASVLVLEGAPKFYRGGNTRHTRNMRCAHDAATEILTGPYTEEMRPFVELMLNKRVALRVDVDRVRSWDHSKLGMEPTELGGYDATNPLAEAVRSRLHEILEAKAAMHDDAVVVSGLRLGATDDTALFPLHSQDRRRTREPCAEEASGPVV